MLARAVMSLLVLVLSTPALSDEIEVFNGARPSLAKLVAMGSNGRFFFGSAVALPGGALITNCHVTLSARSVAVAQGDAPLRADEQSGDVGHDLCALRLPGLRMRAATLRDSRSLRVGERVYAVGFNHGLGLTYQDGRVEQLYPLDGGAVIRTSASFATGASGGGLFDEEGRLVGILTFYRVVAGHDVEYFAVPVEWIEAALAMRPVPVAPREGTPFWAADLEQQPHFLHAATLEVEGRWDELLSLSQKWIATSPEDGHAWSALGRSLDRTGEMARAAEAFRRAEELGVRRASLP